MSFYLRPAHDLDAGKMGAMLSEFVDQTEWLPKVRSSAEDIMYCATMIERGWVTIATADRPMGFIALADDEILALYVAPNARRNGVGRQLMTYAKERSDRLRLWTYKANTVARAFYRLSGFKEVGRTDGDYNDEGLPDVEYLWERGVE
ncbi:MAG: GNAT family N-acetyltransferase [Donghicola eburneus]|nr:GNAT family N-acetyltransferase [Donghicola eburneus]MCI5041721.1 GNAT family N-acetyltransferase [Donghicola eburneus]